MTVYASDYADQLPRATYPDVFASTWADAIFGGYVRNQQVYDCPASDRHMDRFRGSSPCQTRFLRAEDGYPGVGYSYGINAMEPNHSLQPPIAVGGPAGKALPSIEDPSGTILLCDAGYDQHNTTDYVVRTGYPNLGDYRLEALHHEIDTERHGVPNRFNVGYCDGHARSRNYRRTIDPGLGVNQWTCSLRN